MKQHLLNKLIDVLAVDNRPLQIFFYGGILLAYIIMLLIGFVFGIDTNMGDDIDLKNIILMIVSILLGFWISYSFMCFLENAKESRQGGDELE
ncbi:MAG: hypothetical protein EP297_04860 [Gammaproteobacteria bacterium]|nr:MAG: hypothetical protein EP297_04860 [Gammaproteobacteria bacterium]